MIAIFRRHCFLLAAGVLLWQGWAASDASPAAPPPATAEEAPMPPPQLSAGDLAWRDEDAARLSPADPFYLRELLMRRADEYRPAPTASSKGGQPVQQTLTPMVRLTLQSTMPGGARGRAWINGHDLAIGDAIPGVAEENPPVLQSVAGSTVTIAWAGRAYVLDLYGASAVEVPVTQEELQ